MTENNADYSQTLQSDNLGWYIDDIGYEKTPQYKNQAYDNHLFWSYTGQGSRAYSNPEDILEAQMEFGTTGSVLPATSNIIKSRSEAERRHDYFQTSNKGKIDNGSDRATFDRNLLQGESVGWNRRDWSKHYRQMERERLYMNERKMQRTPDYSTIRQTENYRTPRDLSWREKYKEREWANKEAGMATASQGFLHHRGEADPFVTPYINTPTPYKVQIDKIGTQNTSYRTNEDLLIKDSTKSNFITEKRRLADDIIYDFNQKFEAELEQSHTFIKTMSKDEIKKLRDQMIREQIDKLEIIMNMREYTPLEKNIAKEELIANINEKLDLYIQYPTGYKSPIKYIRDQIMNEYKDLSIEYDKIIREWQPRSNKIENDSQIEIKRYQIFGPKNQQYDTKQSQFSRDTIQEHKILPIYEFEKKIARLHEIRKRMNEMILDIKEKQIIELENHIKNLEKKKSEKNYDFSDINEKQVIENKISQLKDKLKKTHVENQAIFETIEKTVVQHDNVLRKLKSMTEKGKSEINVNEQLELIHSLKTPVIKQEKPNNQVITDTNIKENIITRKKQGLKKVERTTQLNNTNVIIQ